MIPRLLLRSFIACGRRPLCARNPIIQPSHGRGTQPWRSQQRLFVSKTEADAKIEELQELYATAKDEFEIASEETERKTLFAADDRAAAQEELQKLKAAFEEAVEHSEPGVGAEIQARVGQRIRELDRAVEAMEEKALED